MLPDSNALTVIPNAPNTQVTLATNLYPNSSEGTSTSLPNHSSTADVQKEQPVVDLDTVRSNLKNVGITADFLAENSHSLSEITKLINDDNFEYNNNGSNELPKLKTECFLPQISLIKNILSTDQKLEYRPLIKLLFAEKLNQYKKAELKDGAVIMHCLIEINQICNSESHSLYEALKKIITIHEPLAPQDDIVEIDQFIVWYNNRSGSLDLIKLLYEDQNLRLKNPFENPHNVNDESTEPHGFWASIGYAIWHPIEFVTEKIWGKKKVDTTANSID